MKIVNVLGTNITEKQSAELKAAAENLESNPNPRKKVTLSNDFHRTNHVVMVSDGEPLSASQVARSRDALCGMSVCTCASTGLGTRGRQDAEITVDTDRDGVEIFTVR